MGMDKRDIALAQCGVYLLSWLIRDADKDRHHAMKGSLAFIHRALDDEDEATSEEKPGPLWKKLFPIPDEGGDMQGIIEDLEIVRDKLTMVTAHVFDLPRSERRITIYALLCNIAKQLASILELLRQPES